MITSSIVTAAVAAGLSFGIAVPAQAIECTVEHVLVTPAVDAQAAVYGDAPLLTEAQEAWIESVLVSPAVDEVSHIVHHDAVTTTVHHDAVTTEVAHEAETKVVHHDAVTKVVTHPAETNVIHHDAVTKVVTHPAETKVVHHDAVTQTVYTRYSWVGGRKGPRNGSTPATAPKDWNADNKKYDGSKTNVVRQQGEGNGSYFYWWEREEIKTAAYDETVVVKAAWDETVVVTEAWDEKVVEVEAQDAVYVDIVHPAQPAVFGEPALITPAIDAIPAVYEDVESCVSAEGPDELPLSDDNGTVVSGEGANAAPATLALTGGGVNPILPAAAGALVIGGAALLLTRRSRRSER